MEIFKVNDLAELELVVPKIWDLVKDNKIIILNGTMGAGKTTLVSLLLNYIGLNDAVSSPTYSLVNEYLGPDNSKFFHFDFYRIKNTSEAIDIGCEDYFYSGCYCFIEWAEKIEQLIPDNFVKITIETEGFIRYISVSK